MKSLSSWGVDYCIFEVSLSLALSLFLPDSFPIYLFWSLSQFMFTECLNVFVKKSLKVLVCEAL